MRDVTSALFEYVLNNVIRTKHYGAQTTRTGGVANHILAIALTDGEIFSNLKFCQKLYDEMADAIQPPAPVNVPLAREKATAVIPTLLQMDGVTVDQLLVGDSLANWLKEFSSRLSDAKAMKQLLETAFNDSRRYYESYI